MADDLMYRISVIVIGLLPIALIVIAVVSLSLCPAGMRHRGIEFSIERSSEREDVWIWRFAIGDKVRTGKTATKLELLAIRRAQLMIDRKLKKGKVPPQHDIESELT